jgi:hypothetical protein
VETTPKGWHYYRKNEDPLLICAGAEDTKMGKIKYRRNENVIERRTVKGNDGEKGRLGEGAIQGESDSGFQA